MNEFLKNKQCKFLIIIFILVSLLHIIYATVTMRGMYEDGAFYMLDQLNSYSNGVFKISSDYSHPRFCIMALLELPSIFSYYILFIHNKYALMMIFSCAMFLFPLLALLWNFQLSKKTQRLDIFFWSLFSYSLIIITFSIFSVVECILGSMLHFILWNYLAGKINYSKKDIALIIFLVVVMFGTYEYVIYLGVIFFIAALMYAKREENIKNKIVKLSIGIGSLCASLFNLIYALKVPGEHNEILRFMTEGLNVIPHIINLNFSLSLIAVALLCIVIFSKKPISITTTIIFVLIFLCHFNRMLNVPLLSIFPMWEQHLRTIPCYALPIIFMVICLFDFFKKEQNYTKLTNYICVVLLCGIFQTAWQLIDTYYWDKNIQYMKSELNNCQDLLYVPSEHEEISSFQNKDLRRYIWHGFYSTTSILFSDSYEQKTLLLHYENSIENGHEPFRDFLHMPKTRDDIIAMPLGLFSIKNKFWDLTKCAEALRKYDEAHNIESKFYKSVFNE